MCDCCENSCEVLLELAEGSEQLIELKALNTSQFVVERKKLENGGNNISICEIGKHYQD